MHNTAASVKAHFTNYMKIVHNRYEFSVLTSVLDTLNFTCSGRVQ